MRRLETAGDGAESANGNSWAGMSTMSDAELNDLRMRAADGDSDAIAELVELAGERGDADELRRLADQGSRDAVDELVQLAAERNDVDELRRLAATGNRDAADVLTELEEESGSPG